MKRQPGEPELIGAADAAQIIGVGQTNLRTLRGLPEPYQDMPRGAVYRLTEVKAFARQRAKVRAKAEAEKLSALTEMAETSA